MFHARADNPSKAELAREFADPPASYGPIDGWWWEAGRLDRDKMRWQLEELKDKGIAGTWFYARYLYGEPIGSNPGYFSDEWWEFTRFAAEEQKRLGLINWFSNWTALQFEQDVLRAKSDEKPELKGRRVVLYKKEGEGSLAIAVANDDEVLDVGAYRKDGDAVDHNSRVDLNDAIADGKVEWTSPDANGVLTVVAARPWDLDYIGTAVGEGWTDVVLGQYERHLPELMGEGVGAFGPDELEFLKGTTPYSPELLDAVASETGFDVRPYLIGLFVDIGARTEQIRCTYHEVVCRLLDENFYLSPTRWLHDRSMMHVSLSQNGDSPLQFTYQYGDFFRYLRSFDVPGNEDPGPAPPGQRALIHSKLSSSVANLYGKMRAVVLGHYATGWGHTLEDNLAWTNEAYTYGLNLYSRHLGSYSLMGGWYEYVPPHDHWYHPYWRYWKTFADHMRRLSYVMSHGNHRADVALLYPLTAIHADHVAEIVGVEGQPDDGDDEGPLEKLFGPGANEPSEGAVALAHALFSDAIDFDFIDDDSMVRAGIDGDVLSVAGLEFRCVVLPPMSTIRRSTLEKVKEFFDNGGTVVAFGRLPSASVEDGRDDPKLPAILGEMFGPKANGKGFLVTGDIAQVPTVISNAIVRDVVASAEGIVQTHQRIGDVDVYFVFSIQEEPREVTLQLRVAGEVERWDPSTGSRHPVVSKRNGSSTEVTLRIDTFDAVLLVVSPEGTDPRASDPGPSERVGLGDEIAAPIALTGPFDFALEPTMDNRWGDFRYPASEKLIGAEARRFRYSEGTDAGHARDLDDAGWEEVQYTHGPYWLHLGPFGDDNPEPDNLLERAKRGDESLSWGRYSFSKKHGSRKRVDRAGFLGWFQHLIGVPENFIVLDGGTEERPSAAWVNWDEISAESQGDHHHYLFTTVVAPEDGEYLLALGRKAGHPELSGLDQDAWLGYKVPDGTAAWINGDEVYAAKDEQVAEVRAKVHLRDGPNAVLLRVVHPQGVDPASYAVLLSSEPAQQDPFAPQLSWFIEQQRLTYDIKNNASSRTAWFRFTAPPGTKQIVLNANARSVEAWVDGEPVEVQDGVITLAAAREEASTVALHVEQHSGTYAGAVFDEPVEFVCERGSIPLGDWSASGLATYSGIGVYGTEVSLDRAQLGGRVLLDLGMVKTVAEVSVNGKPAGVRIARPYRFDITDLVVEGTNTIEIKVANTLANHYSTYPTRWVFDGQTVSGLLGPVKLRFPSRLDA